MGEWILVKTKVESACHLSDVGRRKAESSWLCSDCGRPRRNVDRIDANFREGLESPFPVQLEAISGLLVFRTEFLYDLRVDFSGNLESSHPAYFGLASSEGSGLSYEWRTFHGRAQWIVRGDKPAKFRRCQTCGNLVYYAPAATRPYLNPAPVYDEKILDVGGFGKFLIRADARPALEKYAKCIDFWPVIVAEPKDGLEISAADLK